MGGKHLNEQFVFNLLRKINWRSLIEKRPLLNRVTHNPNTGELLTWDKTKSRFGQWDMGRTPGHEYNKLWQDYMDGKISRHSSNDSRRTRLVVYLTFYYSIGKVICFSAFRYSKTEPEGAPNSRSFWRVNSRASSRLESSISRPIHAMLLS